MEERSLRLLLLFGLEDLPKMPNGAERREDYQQLNDILAAHSEIIGLKIIASLAPVGERLAIIETKQSETHTVVKDLKERLFDNNGSDGAIPQLQTKVSAIEKTCVLCSELPQRVSNLEKFRMFCKGVWRALLVVASGITGVAGLGYLAWRVWGA